MERTQLPLEVQHSTSTDLDHPQIATPNIDITDDFAIVQKWAATIRGKRFRYAAPRYKGHAAKPTWWFHVGDGHWIEKHPHEIEASFVSFLAWLRSEKQLPIKITANRVAHLERLARLVAIGREVDE